MNKNSQLTTLAKQIIRENKYLTLATADQFPWAAPIYYAVNDQQEFYFISQLDSLHTQHIVKNHNVAFAIFDSHQPEGTGNGVQGSGKAYLVEKKEIVKELRWYHSSFLPMKIKSFCGAASYRFFKLIPEHIYILDPEATTDKRVEIFMNSI